MLRRLGFSLAEVLVGLLVVILAITAIYSIYLLSRTVKNQSETRAELIQNERAMLDRLTRELRQANTIVTLLPAAEIMFEDGHGNLAGQPIQYIRYYLNGTGLYREVSYYSFASDPLSHVVYNEIDGLGHPPNKTITENRLVAEYITNLNFSGIAAKGNIIIDLTCTKANQTINLTSYVNSRNLK